MEWNRLPGAHCQGSTGLQGDKGQKGEVGAQGARDPRRNWSRCLRSQGTKGQKGEVGAHDPKDRKAQQEPGPNRTQGNPVM